MSKSFAFTASGPVADVRDQLAALPDQSPGFPQDAADFLLAQIAAIPEDKSLTLTVQGVLGWQESQIAGPLAFSVFGNVS